MGVPSCLARSTVSFVCAIGALILPAAALAAPPPELFAKHGVAPPSDAKQAAAAERATERVTDLCQAPEGMREGPSAAESSQCEHAVADLAKIGAQSASAVMSSLDDQRIPIFAREKLLDAVARTADTDTLAALVTALERLAQRASSGTEGSAALSQSEISDVLRRITQADPFESVPWSASETASNTETSSIAKGWRTWVDGHKAKSRAELETSAIEGARESVKSGDVTRGFLGARRLAGIKKTRAEGLRALETLSKKSDLTEAQKNALDNLIGETRVEMGLPQLPATPPPVQPKRPSSKKPQARS